MMMGMLRRRRRRRRRRENILTLRKMMLRRETNPRTRKHTLCEPAQSTCTLTLHKSIFAWTCAGSPAMPDIASKDPP